MNHDEALELLELAAAERDGFERLAAGDRPEAAALAGHLAGCPSCRAEADALRRLAVVLETVLPELPADDLRDRTLAAVATLGRPRLAAAGSASPAPPDAASAPMAVSTPSAVVATPAATTAPSLPAAPAPPTAVPVDGGSPARLGPSRRRSLLRLAALAAAAVVAFGIGFAGGSVSREAELGQRALVVASLERLAVTSLAVAAAPDARTVALASADGRAAGWVLYSPQSRQLVVVARGLEPPSRGELRCWVEIAGERTVVGRMVFADDLAYWAGPAEVLAGASGPIRLGVSLVADGGSPGEPILEGGS